MSFISSLERMTVYYRFPTLLLLSNQILKTNFRVVPPLLIDSSPSLRTPWRTTERRDTGVPSPLMSLVSDVSLYLSFWSESVFSTPVTFVVYTFSLSVYSQCWTLLGSLPLTSNKIFKGRNYRRFNTVVYVLCFKW